MEGYLASSHTLGIGVTLVDDENSFLLPAEVSEAIEHRVSIDMTPDGCLPNRIVEAVSKFGIYHGIVTFTDKWLTAVARATNILQLPTLAVHTVETCLDKHATRLPCNGSSDAQRINSIEELQTT
jgi:hypothetical protein